MDNSDECVSITIQVPVDLHKRLVDLKYGTRPRPTLHQLVVEALIRCYGGRVPEKRDRDGGLKSL